MLTFASSLPLSSSRPHHAVTRKPPSISAIATRIIDASSTDPLHPVLQILKRRLETGSKPGHRSDGRKVALCIEGGGMRGAVAAGMCAAIKYCGYHDALDVVYGCSAGAIVGAYFVARQLPRYGGRIYYDEICATCDNGQRFIDLWAFRHHPYLRLNGKGEGFYANGARPVLLLDLLIDVVMRQSRPLNWKQFSKYHKVQPLKPVASSLDEMRAKALDGYQSLDELLECLRASARVPGIAGDPVEIDGELFADGLLFEPIPYRSAEREGCTDVLVLRTKQDAVAEKGTKPGIYEKHIASPYFDMVPSFAPRARASEYLAKGMHLSVYNNDLRRLRKEMERPGEEGNAAIFSVIPPKDAPVVGQLESRARVVFEGVRNGFAAAYEVLSPCAKEGEGARVAKWVYGEDELEEVERIHAMRRRRRRLSRRRKRKRHSDLVSAEERILLDRRYVME